MYVPLKNTKIFTGNSNPKLAKGIVDYLGVSLGKVELSTFADGEVKCEFEEPLRGQHVVIIQSTCKPVNDNLMELLVMADAARRSDIKSLTAVVPYYGYSRQDRRPGFTRTPITSRLVAGMIENAGFDKVVVVDIHSEQQKGFFNIPFTNIPASPEIAGHIWRQHDDINNLMIVSPDTGGVVRARAVAKEANNADLAIIDKRRPEANVSEVMNVIGNVNGRDCVLIDDMVDTAGTLCKGAQALKDRGARSVVAYATHAVLSGPAYENIENSAFDEVIVTDTIPVDTTLSKKIKVISIAGLIGETLLRMRSKQSISAMYQGC